MHTNTNHIAMSFDQLVDDTTLLIFSYLSHFDLKAVACASKKYEVLANNNLLWKMRIKEDFKYGKYYNQPSKFFYNHLFSHAIVKEYELLINFHKAIFIEDFMDELEEVDTPRLKNSLIFSIYFESFFDFSLNVIPESINIIHSNLSAFHLRRFTIGLNTIIKSIEKDFPILLTNPKELLANTFKKNLNYLCILNAHKSLELVCRKFRDMINLEKLLCIAIQFCHIEIIEKLILLGVNLNSGQLDIPGEQTESAIDYLFVLLPHIIGCFSIIKNLYEHVTDHGVYQKFKKIETIVTLLLKNGADPDIPHRQTGISLRQRCVQTLKTWDEGKQNSPFDFVKNIHLMVVNHPQQKFYHTAFNPKSHRMCSIL